MATDISAITDTLNKSAASAPRQFQGAFDIIPFTFSMLDTTQAADTGAQCDISVPGAALGDIVLIGTKVDLTGGILVAQVSAANVVTVSVWNMEGTDAITPFVAAIECNGVVLKPKANVFDQVA